MNTLIRILYVNGGLMNRGGIESMMMNYYRHFDRKRVQIDFAVHDAGGFGYYDEEIRDLGGRIFVLPKKSTHPFSYMHQLKALLRAGEYRIVHTHMDAMGTWVLKAAKECGVPVRIAHSHNTQHLTSNPLKLYFLEKARRNMNRYATHRMACSDVAGKWLFADAQFEIVRNAIDVEQFAFDAELRMKTRREYELGDDEFVIGHVGRFDHQKNHRFLIDVFAEVVKHEPKCKLMLIGGGEITKNDCREQVKLLGLENRVIFMGVRNDAFRLYNAFDLFALPSLFEGLGMVSVEAQVNGCHNILSSTIPKEVNISGDVEFLPLQKERWINRIVELAAAHGERCKADFDIHNSGYDINQEAQLLQQKYIELWNNNTNVC